jgi:benzoylformate decarboxylase
VLALLGDGAALYGIQGLWSAARYRLPVTFVVCNNAQYQILKIGAKGLQLPHAMEGHYEGLDITGPEIDFVGIARAFGVEAHRVTEPGELAERVRESLQQQKLVLFEVPIRREVQARLNYG